LSGQLPFLGLTLPIWAFTGDTPFQRLSCLSLVPQFFTIPCITFGVVMHRRQLKSTFLIASLCFPFPFLTCSASTNLNQLKNLQQIEFNRLSKDFVAAASYKGIVPAEPLGITGFDLGAEMGFTQLNNGAIWKKAGADVSTLIMPKLHAHKGLPFNIDVGAFVTAVPNSDIKLLGVEARYSLLEGGVAKPAIAIRGAMTKLSGVNQLDLDTKSLEMMVSKGFLNLTPYVGVGKVWGSSTPRVGNLVKTSPTANKIFAGINANFGMINYAAELDRTGDNDTATIKVSFRW
jgi:hypothetical protein